MHTEIDFPCNARVEVWQDILKGSIIGDVWGGDHKISQLLLTGVFSVVCIKMSPSLSKNSSSFSSVTPERRATCSLIYISHKNALPSHPKWISINASWIPPFIFIYGPGFYNWIVINTVSPEPRHRSLHRHFQVMNEAHLLRSLTRPASSRRSWLKYPAHFHTKKD